MTGCLSQNDIMRFALGHKAGRPLSDQEWTSCEAHCQTCEPCSALLSECRSFVYHMEFMELLRDRRRREAFGALLAAARRGQNFTLRDVEAATEVSEGFMSQLEHGEIVPVPALMPALSQVLSRLSRLYGLSYGELLELAGAAAVSRILQPDDGGAQYDVGGQRHELAGELLWLTLAGDIEGSLQRLARLAYDTEVVLGLTGQRVIEWLVGAVAGNQDRCAMLEPALSNDDLPFGLLPLAITVCQTLVSDDAQDDLRQADRLNNLGIWWSRLGQLEEALKALQAAVEVYRVHGEPFHARLAMSLTNLSTTLADVGRHEEALGAIKEAVTLCRRLAHNHPKVFRRRLAGALVNLGSVLHRLKAVSKARPPLEEATAIYRRMTPRPEALQHEFTLALHNLGLILSALSDHEAAVQAMQEAVAIQHELADKRPEMFLPGFAQSLANLGGMLAMAGRREEALAPARAAVEKLQALEAARPGAFLPELAAALHNLARLLSSLDRFSEAVPYATAGVDIRRHLAEKWPEAHVPVLAQSLLDLQDMWQKLGSEREAWEAGQEFEELRPRLELHIPLRAGQELDVPLPDSPTLVYRRPDS